MRVFTISIMRVVCEEVREHALRVLLFKLKLFALRYLHQRYADTFFADI